MDIRNRMADVVKLRCNACQDFLKLIIADNWQQAIYDIAQEEIDTNGKHKGRYKDKYIHAYDTMREKGIENYSINDMDVTFISQIVHWCKDIAPTSEETRKCIEQLTKDRNFTNHSNENEKAEELYLRGLLALCHLKDFIEAVDKNESNISDNPRRDYRSKYAKRIEELMETLDEERISLIQNRKSIEKDIQKILDCTDDAQRFQKWCDINQLYVERYMKQEKDIESYDKFAVLASDAGIREAHYYAVVYFSSKKDYKEVERRLYMLYEAYNPLPACEAYCIVRTIDGYLSEGNTLTDGMDELIKLVIKQGYLVEKDERGRFSKPKKPRNS